MSGVAVIAGAGPGFCESLAWKLAREGHKVGLIARSEEYIVGLESELRDAGHEAHAIPMDLTKPEEVREGFERLRADGKKIDVLAYTASTTTAAGEGTDSERYEDMWRVYAYGSVLCVEAALDDLRDVGGTVMFFGARPDVGDYAYRSAKDAARGFARSLAGKYAPEGIHVAHVVINGSLLNPDVYDRVDDVNEAEYIDPDAAAQTCYHLIEQDDRAQTFELDLHTQAQGSFE